MTTLLSEYQDTLYSCTEVFNAEAEQCGEEADFLPHIRLLDLSGTTLENELFIGHHKITHVGDNRAFSEDGLHFDFTSLYDEGFTVLLLAFADSLLDNSCDA